MGPKAAMAAPSLEEVIGEHYQKQADTLGEDERDLHAIVERFQDEELEHRDIAVDHEGREARYYELLRSVIGVAVAPQSKSPVGWFVVILL